MSYDAPFRGARWGLRRTPCCQSSARCGRARLSAPPDAHPGSARCASVGMAHEPGSLGFRTGVRAKPPARKSASVAKGMRSASRRASNTPSYSAPAAALSASTSGEHTRSCRVLAATLLARLSVLRCAKRAYPCDGALDVRYQSRVRHRRWRRGRRQRVRQARWVAQSCADGFVRQPQQRLQYQAHQQARRQVRLRRERQRVRSARVAVGVRARGSAVARVLRAHAASSLLRVDAHQRVQAQPARTPGEDASAQRRCAQGASESATGCVRLSAPGVCGEDRVHVGVHVARPRHRGAHRLVLREAHGGAAGGAHRPRAAKRANWATPRRARRRRGRYTARSTHACCIDSGGDRCGSRAGPASFVRHVTAKAKQRRSRRRDGDRDADHAGCVRGARAAARLPRRAALTAAMRGRYSAVAAQLAPACAAPRRAAAAGACPCTAPVARGRRSRASLRCGAWVQITLAASCRSRAAPADAPPAPRRPPRPQACACPRRPRSCAAAPRTWRRGPAPRAWRAAPLLRRCACALTWSRTTSASWHVPDHSCHLIIQQR